MSVGEKHYWKSVAQRQGVREEPPAPGVSRRGFLEAAGFTVSLAALGGCQRAPVREALPYVAQPEGARPGRPLRFATTCGGCPAGCGLLATVRDGRPLKMEGLPEHPLSRGGLCAVGQALPLGLYDSQRLTAPRQNGQPATWPEVDAAIRDQLARTAARGGRVRVVTPTITSPTLRHAIDQFLKQFPDGRQITFDPLGGSAILAAHEQTHGRRVLPRYRLDRARVIVSLDADFLGAWYSPVEHTVGWRQGRTLPLRAGGHAADATHEPGGKGDGQHAAGPESPHDPGPIDLAYHVQFESRMTLTGSNADRRYVVHPSVISAVAAWLWQRVLGVRPAGAPPGDAAQLDALAQRLRDSQGQALVLCGSHDVATQVIVNRLNDALGAYGQTLDLDAPSRQRQDNAADLAALVADLKAGRIAGLIVAGVDLTYYLPPDEALDAALENVPLTIAIGEHLGDFAGRARFVCPDQHPLESWLDAEPVAGLFSIRQPTISPLADTRSALESFAAWSGRAASALELVQAYWREQVFPRPQAPGEFQAFWDRAVQDGFVDLTAEVPRTEPVRRSADQPRTPLPAASDELTLVLHPTAAIPDARHAHNPWLQELPDPITKVTWDNFAAISPRLAEQQGLAQDDVVQITVAGGSLELPVCIQPGQHERVVAVALNYGVPGTQRFAKVGPQWFQARPTVGAGGRVGVNAAPLVALTSGGIAYVRGGVQLKPTGRRQRLATTQLHDLLEVPAATRPPGSEARQALVQETTLAEYRRDPTAGAPHAHHFDGQLWPDDHPSEGHRWGMVIDLNRCSGCSACLIACQSENNVPVVGRDEVQRHREMHWIRIDRYYAGDEAEPEVVHQPMLCQHCAHAPCETVCPVLATVHSREGLNQQVYNRCVGTRYCANNCPYKVRRFNWFDYAHDDTLQNLALNPDVTVRMRGIMEKCSFCVQRIQEGKIEARRRGIAVADGAIQAACQQSCPGDAIVFGDLNDPASRVAQAMRDARRFTVLEELNVRPSVGYLRKVRNEG